MENIVFESNGGVFSAEYTIAEGCTEKMTLSTSDGSWLTAEAVDGEIKITAQKNSTKTSRKGTATILMNSVPCHVFDIAQDGATNHAESTEYVWGTCMATIDACGGSVTVSVPYTATTTYTDGTNSKVFSYSSVTVTVDANESSSSKTIEENHVTITQGGGPCSGCNGKNTTYSFTPTTAFAESCDAVVNVDIPYTATTTYSNCPSETLVGVSSTTIPITVNNTRSSRAITNGSCTIYQAGGPCDDCILSAINYSYEAQALTVSACTTSVELNIPYTAIEEYSNCESALTTGTSAVTVGFGENGSQEPRVIGGGVCPYTITQEAGPCEGCDELSSYIKYMKVETAVSQCTDSVSLEVPYSSITEYTNCEDVLHESGVSAITVNIGKNDTTEAIEYNDDAYKITQAAGPCESYVHIQASQSYFDYSGGTFTITYFVSRSSTNTVADIITDVDIDCHVNFSHFIWDLSDPYEIQDGVWQMSGRFSENTLNTVDVVTFTATCESTNNKTDTVTLYLNTKPIVNIGASDYFILTYNWASSDGKDLDTLTIINSDEITSLSGNPINTYAMGYISNESRRQLVNEDSTVTYAEWAGDNTGDGDESVVIYWKNIRESADTTSNIVEVDIFANWFNTRLNGNMILYGNAYLGSDGHSSSEEISKSGYDYIANTALTTNIWSGSFTRTITAASSSNAVAGKVPTSVEKIGQYYTKVATLTYNLITKEITLAQAI